MADGRYYRWRELTDVERERALHERRRLGRPWHSPPHFKEADFGSHDHHLSAACYEHQPWIGLSVERIETFSQALLRTLDEVSEAVFAWCVLPNHYHVLVRIADLKVAANALGQLHGRSSFQWNGEEKMRGRKVFCRAADRRIRSDRHYFAALNYVHHNPVRHGYVARRGDWPWSSAREFVERIGKEEAERIWREYPLLDFGDGWDDPNL